MPSDSKQLCTLCKGNCGWENNKVVQCKECVAIVHVECFSMKYGEKPVEGGFLCGSCDIEGKQADTSLKRGRSTSRGRPPGKARKVSEDSTIIQFLTDFKQELKSDLSSNFSEFQSTVNNQFAVFRNELAAVKQSHTEILESISFMSNKYDEIIPKVNQAVTTSNNAKEAIESVQNQVASSTERLEKIEANVNRQAQAALRNHLVITGLVKSANATDSFWKLVAATNAKVNRADVSGVDLLKKKFEAKDNAGSKKGAFIADTILVRFNSNGAKGEFIKAKKTMGAAFSNQVKDCAAFETRTKKPRTIFYRDHLTDYSMVLFEQAKLKKEELKYKFVWTKDGQILMRKNESEPVHYINSAADLAKLLP